MMQTAGEVSSCYHACVPPISRRLTRLWLAQLRCRGRAPRVCRRRRRGANIFACRRGWHPALGARPYEASTHPRAAWDDHHSTRSGLRRTLGPEPRGPPRRLQALVRRHVQRTVRPARETTRVHPGRMQAGQPAVSAKGPQSGQSYNCPT
jgi:hypothetical protein